MRTIKFRGIRIESNEWVYGSLDLTDKPPSISWLRTDEDGEQVPWFAYVKADTVGQFTDIIDKNGNEIYEGDIISIEEYGELGVVVFEEGAFKVNNKYQEKVTLIACIPENLEVTGNIYQKQKFQPCCGNCQHFSNEDAEGIGYCNRIKKQRICGETCKNHQAK